MTIAEEQRALDGLPRRLVPRTLFLLKGRDAHGLWRTRWVCSALTAHGYVADYCDVEQIETITGLIQSGRYNLLVTPRFIIEDAADQLPPFLDQLHDDGMRWVYELDDDTLSPSIVDHQLACFDVCRKAGRERLEYERQQRLYMIARADGVITSTPLLGAVASTCTTAPVYVVPNAIDVPWMVERLQQVDRRERRLTIGWAGGARPDADLIPVADAWRRLAQRYPDVVFLVFGERMQVLMDAIPKGQHRRIHIPWVEVDAFPRGLGYIDIACCAVADTPWNHCKSPDKFFEHTLAGAPCVVSEPLYGPVVTHGVDALVAHDADEWEAALALLIDSPELRRRLNVAALETVAHHHSMQRVWPRWVRALSDILRPRSNGHLERQSNAERSDRELVHT